MNELLSTVYVVEDDASVRLSLVSLFRSIGMEVQAHGSATQFLALDRRPGPCCLVLDMRLPDLDGLRLQSALKDSGRELPIIFITGHGTIPMSVQAMKAGAVEFLTKPFTDEDLVGAVRHALATDREALAAREVHSALRGLYENLTSREREVFALVAAGFLNKQVAAELGITEITVKVHRRHVMEKLEVRTLSDLVLVAERLGVRAKPPADYTKV